MPALITSYTLGWWTPRTWSVCASWVGIQIAIIYKYALLPQESGKEVQRLAALWVGASRIPPQPRIAWSFTRICYLIPAKYFFYLSNNENSSALNVDVIICVWFLHSVGFTWVVNVKFRTSPHDTAHVRPPFRQHFRRRHCLICILYFVRATNSCRALAKAI